MFYKCQVFFGRSSVRLITRMDAPGDPLTIVWFAFENQVCCFRWYTVNTSISSKQNWIHLASKIELMFYHNKVCCFRRYTVYFITLYFVGYYLQCVKDSRPCKTETEAFIGRGVWSGTLPFADNSYLNHWWWTSIYKHYLCSCTRAGELSEHVNFSFWLLFKETMSNRIIWHAKLFLWLLTRLDMKFVQLWGVPLCQFHVLLWSFSAPRDGCAYWLSATMSSSHCSLHGPFGRAV